jgi:phage repressor protein C with HTH and peptisase S24 domain
MIDNKDESDKLELRRKFKDSVPVFTNEIGTRISEVCKRKGSRQKLSEMIGISYSQLLRIITGDSQPKAETVAAIAQAGGVSLDWLMFGVNTAQPEGTEGNSKEQFCYIPIIDVSLDASNNDPKGREYTGQNLAFRKDHLEKKDLDIKSLAVIYASGDSMESDICDGAAQLIDRSQNQLRDGHIYVLRYSNRSYSKKVQLDIDGTVRLISANNAYSDQLISKDQIDELEVIGRVVWSDKWR